MAINITSTKTTGPRLVNCLILGGSGAGKTTLLGTLPGKPIIINAENGLLSLRDKDLASIRVESMEQVREVYRYLKESDEGRSFDHICMDSISEIAEMQLAEEIEKTKDPRQAYGEIINQVSSIIRSFRDLDRSTWVIAKEERVVVDGGGMLYGAMMPGTKLPTKMPYWFDLVVNLRCRDNDGETERTLQTFRSATHDCKDRSGVLDPHEVPDLTTIYNKIANTNKNTEKKEN